MLYNTYNSSNHNILLSNLMFNYILNNYDFEI